MRLLGCSEPTAEYECAEAIYTQGRACKNCGIAKCYRRGWKAEQATADNKKRVAEKHNRR